MYAMGNELHKDDGTLISTHESHWKACEAMLALPSESSPEAKPATQRNLDAFYERLKIEYTQLFATDTDYAFAASTTTPEALARKMALGLDNGKASKDGAGIKRACKFFGIPHTYKAIRAFLSAQ